MSKTSSEATDGGSPYSVLAWLCSVCYIGPASAVQKPLIRDTTACARCPRCGEVTKFVCTDASKRVVRYRKTEKKKPFKTASITKTEKALNAAAQSKGVATKKKDWGRKAHRGVLLKVNQLSEELRLVRPWDLGLGESDVKT